VSGGITRHEPTSYPLARVALTNHSSRPTHLWFYNSLNPKPYDQCDDSLFCHRTYSRRRLPGLLLPITSATKKKTKTSPKALPLSLALASALLPCLRRLLDPVATSPPLRANTSGAHPRLHHRLAAHRHRRGRGLPDPTAPAAASFFPSPYTDPATGTLAARRRQTTPSSRPGPAASSAARALSGRMTFPTAWPAYLPRPADSF
jgi:hypothetical protein